MSSTHEIHTIVSLPFEENTYVAWLPDRKEALVVDPGLDPDAILSFLQDRELKLVAILNTHGHADHIGGNEAMKQAYPDAPLIIGINEAKLLTDAEANLSAPFGFPIISPKADCLVTEGDQLEYAGFRFEVREIPGHSPGHVVFVSDTKPIFVLGGDVLFRGSVGRTDFPGGSSKQLLAGIRKHLYTLPDDTIVYPGHGPVTTIGNEKRTNPYTG